MAMSATDLSVRSTVDAGTALEAEISGLMASLNTVFKAVRDLGRVAPLGSLVPRWFQRNRTEHDAPDGASPRLLGFSKVCVGLRAGASASGLLTNQLLCL